MDKAFKPRKSQNISVKYHGELMENIFSESIIDSSKGIKAIKYSKDESMLFLINKKNELQMFVQVNASASGWVEHRLSPGSMKVSAFDIHHDISNSKLTISYSRIQNGVSQLLISNKINLDNFHMSKINNLIDWTDIRVQNSSKKIDHISMNQSGMLYSTSYKNDDATYVYFKYGETPVEYTLPENTSKVKQLEVGQIQGDFGVFILYDLKSERTMLWQTFPDMDFGGEIEQERLNPTDKLNGFYTVTNSEGDSVVYLAGDGVYKYSRPKGSMQFKSTVVCKKGSGIDFHKVEVAEHNDEVSVWTIGSANGKKGLYYITNRFYENATSLNTSKWTSPIQMQENVEEFSGVKGSTLSNELYLLGSVESSDALIHFWQDSKTTTWHEQPVLLSDLNNVKTFETFTLNMEFRSEEVVSFHGEKIRLTADQNIFVYIQERKVSIGPDKGYELILESELLNIVYPTKTVASALLSVDANFLDRTVVIDPAHKLKEKIKTEMGNADKLKTARKADGSLLIDSRYHKDLDGITKVTNDAYEHLNRMNLAAGPIGTANVLQLESVGGFLSNVGHAMGDIWHSVKKGFADAVDWVVEKVKDGWKFVVRIAGEVIEWVSNIISDVFHFLERIWEKIKIFFKDLFEYLAFLFNWDDILHTKRVLKEYNTNIINGLADELSNLKVTTDRFFNELQSKIDANKEAIAFKSFNKHTVKNSKNTAKDDKLDPRASWTSSKKSHIEKSGSQKAFIENLPSEVVGPMTILTAHFQKIGNEMSEKFSDLFSKLKKVIDGGMKIGDFLEYMVLTLAQLGLTIAQEIVNLIFEILIGLVKGSNKILNFEINVPFFSYFYKKISGDSLSLNDLLCLIIAIPTTVLYKLGEGEAPFKRDADKKVFIDSGREIFKLAVA